MTIRHCDERGGTASCQNVGRHRAPPLSFGTSWRRAWMEHPLLRASRMNRSLAALSSCALFAALGALAPSVAEAQPTASYQPFGDRTGTIAFTTQPLGLHECDTEIPIRFTMLTSSTTARYLDMWSATSATAGCQTGTTRSSSTSTACEPVPLTGNSFTNAIMHDLMVTPVQLFGAAACTGITTTKTFFVFDTVSSPDTSSTFTTWANLTISIDSQPPSPPTVAAGPAGDTSITVSWTNPSDIGTEGGVRVYFDPNGCGGSSTDGGGADAGVGGSLVAGTTPPASLLVYEQRSQSITSASIPTSSLGWAASTYGQRGAIAVSVLDNAFNPSNLSNVVCAEHLQVSGFWNQYCAEHGLSLDECSSRYGSCSMGLPNRRADSTMIAALGLFLGALVARRRVVRRRSR
jgi:hypothetical protein